MTPIKAGDIFCAPWSDAPGVDFYQVVEAGRAFFTLRAIRCLQTEGDGWRGKLAPIADAFLDDEPLLRRRAHPAPGGRLAFLITRCRAAVPWDGEPKAFDETE